MGKHLQLQLFKQSILKLNKFYSQNLNGQTSHKSYQARRRFNYLSPQKYGKSAYCNLLYTPSKLADNVLYKEVSTFKKIQQQTCKNREFQAINDCLMDKLKYLEEEKGVIINSLNQQIVVYKRIISEMQTKNQERIKQLQRKFKSQVNQIIIDKQEQAKYIQSQKQMLEQRIQQLQKANNKLQQKIDSHEREVADMKNQNLNHGKQIENLNYKIKQKQHQMKDQQQKDRLIIENLHRKVLDTQMIWKEDLREAINRKDVQIEAIEKLHRQEIRKLDDIMRMNSQSHKNQTNDIIHSYEKQLKRLSDLMAAKERSLDNLTIDHREERSKNMSLTKNYESQLNQLTNVKILSSELERENSKLRQLLMQSSLELEKCRQQFLSLDRDNSKLRMKLKGTEEEARTWRQSYYVNKRH